MSALSDERYAFRTAPSIAKETGLSESSVQSLLEEHTDAVRRAPLHDENGHPLYTLRCRPRTAREILAETRAFLAGSSK